MYAIILRVSFSGEYNSDPDPMLPCEILVTVVRSFYVTPVHSSS